MKKLLLISALAAVATLSTYGQGSVSFANNNSTRISYNLSTGGTTFIPAGGTFLAELMYAPDGTAAGEFDSLAVRVGGSTTFGGTLGIAGTFNGGGRTVANLSPAGGFGLFQVRVWEAAGGTDYRDCFSKNDPRYQVGKSLVLRVDTGDPTTTPAGTPASLTSAGLLSSFTVSAVPEPSVIALGVLGVGTLLMLRRRK